MPSDLRKVKEENHKSSVVHGPHGGEPMNAGSGEDGLTPCWWARHRETVHFEDLGQIRVLW
jgi:hypothetical protein